MYWVYENWQARGHKVVIHKASCGDCKNGKGKSGQGTNPAYGRWLGSFQTYLQAEQFDQGVAGARLIIHRCC